MCMLLTFRVFHIIPPAGGGVRGRLICTATLTGISGATGAGTTASRSKTGGAAGSITGGADGSASGDSMWTSGGVAREQFEKLELNSPLELGDGSTLGFLLDPGFSTLRFRLLCSSSSSPLPPSRRRTK